MPVAVVVIESGALYTSAILGVLLSYLSGSDGHYIAYDIVSPLVVRRNPIRHQPRSQIAITGHHLLLDRAPDSIPLEIRTRSTTIDGIGAGEYEPARLQESATKCKLRISHAGCWISDLDRPPRGPNRETGQHRDHRTNTSTPSDTAN